MPYPAWAVASMLPSFTIVAAFPKLSAPVAMAMPPLSTVASAEIEP